MDAANHRPHNGGAAGTLESWRLTVHGHRSSPGAPTVDTVTPGDGTLTVAWTAPSDPGNSAITAYDLRHIRTDAPDKTDANWTVRRGVWTTTSGPLTYTITGLVGGVGYDVQVRAVNTDGDGDWSPTVAGTPTVPNRPPRFPSTETSARTVAENTAPGTGFDAPVEATDPDNDMLTYTLGGADVASFGIVDSSGQLHTSAALNYETKNSYTVTVTATDPSNAAATITVTVTVTDVNEAPEITGQTSINYAENGLGSVAGYTADDPEQDTITWTLAGNRPQRTSPSAAPECSASARRRDHEDPADTGGNNVYEVTVEASDGTHTEHYRGGGHRHQRERGAVLPRRNRHAQRGGFG